MDCLAAFHCGEVVTSVQRAALQVRGACARPPQLRCFCLLLAFLFCPAISFFSRVQTGGTEAVVYSGILGTVGALVPFTTRDDVDFFTHLEMCVRMPALPSLACPALPSLACPALPG